MNARAKGGRAAMFVLRGWLVLLALAATASAQSSPCDLEVEDRVNLLGIDVTAPRLSWKLCSPGATQRAYHVRAASSLALLTTGAADLWDSGKVESSQSTGLPYPGPELHSRDRVLWQVRVWTDQQLDDPSDWSAPATWEMGLLSPVDWLAQWITHPTWTYGLPMPIFAKQFSVSRTVQSARLYITGLGIYVATLNGQPVTDDVLTPGNTNYAKQVEYATYDVTNLLSQGANTLGVELGNGTFNSLPTPGRYSKFVNPLPSNPRLIAQLEVTYADGARESVVSDASWRTTLGPTTLSTWFGGEDYDARREKTGWDQPGADLSGWDHAAFSIAPQVTTQLAWRPAPPVRIAGQVSPVAITQPQPGVYVFDMGVNFAGWQQLRVSGPAGTSVTMRIGELLRADGTVSQATTGSPIIDTYILSGNGVETWHPKFEYHGFRFLEVSGLPAAPAPETITGLVLRGSNESAGSFSSSDGLLNDIHRIIDRAIQSNMLSIFTDCPDREKLGWLGDMQVIFGSIARNYDIAAYVRTIIRNMAEAQLDSGLVPDVVPEYTTFSGGFRDDPNWGNAMILAPWSLYETYGDVRILEKYYPNMQRYLAYLTGKASGDLLNYGLNDWAAFDRTTPTEVIASYGYYRSAETLSRVAAVLGRAEDAAGYAALARRIGDAFNAKYLNRTKHTYAGGQQGADGIALDMGIVPAGERQAVLNHLVASIRANGNHINVGIVALQAVLRALIAGGRHDIIYDFAMQTTSPSYGYQIAHGATSLTELWDGPTAGASQNHMMFGAIDEWFTAGLAGIQQAPGSVGYKSLVIKPAIITGLTYVKGSYRSPYGLVESEWKSDGGQVWLHVTVPSNSTAAIYVPVFDGQVLQAPEGLIEMTTEGGYAIYQAGPGSFEFLVRSHPEARPRQVKPPVFGTGKIPRPSTL
jgi:alpha-L-rhamnosidase